MTFKIVRAASMAAAAALLAGTQAASAQEATPILHTGAAEITVGGRVHTQFTTSTVDSVPVQEWALRRVRLESSVRVNDVVGGKVQLDFAGNKVSVKDAYLTMELDPALRILVGNAHRPFGIITQTTSNRIPFVERGTRIRGLDDAWDEHNLVAELGYSDRDLGLQVHGAPHGAPLGLFYDAAFTNGPARAKDVRDDTYQLSARAGVHPLPHTTLAASWSRRDFVDGESVETGMAWAGDLEIGRYAPGLHLVAEAAYGDFDPFAGAHFFGAQAWLAYRTPELAGRIKHLEPALRVSHGDPDVEDDLDVASGGTLVTPGLNLYVGGLNRIMVDYDFWRGDDGRRESSFKAQFQLAF